MRKAAARQRHRAESLTGDTGVGLAVAPKVGLPGAELLSPGGPLRQGHIWGGGQGGSVVGFSGQQCFPASNGGAQPIPGRRPLVMPRAVRASRGPANLCGLAASVSQVPRASVTDVQPCPRHMEGSGLVCALTSFPRIA